MTSTADLKTLKLTRTMGESTLIAEVSPCSWMHPRYGLQIEVTLNGRGRALAINKSRSFTEAKEADAQALLDAVGVIPCKCCGKPAYDPMTVQTNRDGKCEDCFIRDLRAEFDAARAEEDKQVEALAAKAKADGFSYMVTAWIHPAGGDDREVVFFTRTASPRSIKPLLRKEGCVRQDDYAVKALRPVQRGTLGQPGDHYAPAPAR